MEDKTKYRITQQDAFLEESCTQWAKMNTEEFIHASNYTEDTEISYVDPFQMYLKFYKFWSLHGA
jgi:hypothetical protein